MVPINHVVSYDGQIVGVNCQSPTHTTRGAVLQWPRMRASIWLLPGLCSFQRQNYPICNPPWTHSGYFHWLISDDSEVNRKWTQKRMLALYWVPCTLGFSQGQKIYSYTEWSCLLPLPVWHVWPAMVLPECRVQSWRAELLFHSQFLCPWIYFTCSFNKVLAGAALGIFLQSFSTVSTWDRSCRSNVAPEFKRAEEEKATHHLQELAAPFNPLNITLLSCSRGVTMFS